MVDPIAVASIVLAVGGFGAYFADRARSLRRHRAAWQDAIRACRLRKVRSSGWIGFASTARSDSFAIRVQSVGRPSGVVLEVRVHDLTDRIALLMPEIVQANRPVTSNEDVVVGEPRLDDRMILSGEPLVVRAMLDGETRDLLLALVLGTTDPSRPAPPVRALHLSDGTLSIDAESSELPNTLRTLLRLAERLAEVPPVEEAVAAVAVDDCLPSVRIECLRALVEERPRHPATRSALRTALSDPDARVRLVAALTLRTEGREVLLAIARDPDSADDLASRAIPALAAHLPADDAERTLEQAVRARRYETAAACLDSLAARGAAGLPPIRRVLEGPSDTCAALAAQALGISGTAEAEPLLARALDHESAELRTAAARSLGRVGTAAAVPALRALAEGGDAALQRIVRESVASIQSRLSGAGQGQLALAAEGGGVSLSDGSAGRLGLTNAGTKPSSASG
ncbi:MAG: HEAT repeat domain-containing protein [Vicinamibacteria bacterium]